MSGAVSVLHSTVAAFLTQLGRGVLGQLKLIEAAARVKVLEKLQDALKVLWLGRSGTQAFWEIDFWMVNWCVRVCVSFLVCVCVRVMTFCRVSLLRF